MVGGAAPRRSRGGQCGTVGFAGVPPHRRRDGRAYFPARPHDHEHCPLTKIVEKTDKE